MDTIASSDACAGRPRSASILSIIVDDFDSKDIGKEVQQQQQQPTGLVPLKKILDEVEHRKDEFRKLIDEHSAVIENLKKMEENAAALPTSTTTTTTSASMPITT